MARSAARDLASVGGVGERVMSAMPEGSVAERVASAAAEATRPRSERKSRSLADLGEELLSKSRDVNYDAEAHPAYERIINDLAPDEGRILRLLFLGGPQPGCRRPDRRPDRPPQLEADRLRVLDDRPPGRAPPRRPGPLLPQQPVPPRHDLVLARDAARPSPLPGGRGPAGSPRGDALDAVPQDRPPQHPPHAVRRRLLPRLPFDRSRPRSCPSTQRPRRTRTSGGPPAPEQ